MRLKLIPVLTICLLLMSCSKKDDVIPEIFTKVDNVNGTYLITKEEHTVPSVVGGTGQFQYNGNKPHKRNGGYITISAAGGLSGIYSPDIYDIVQYDGPGKITITSQDDIDALVVYRNKREISIDKGLVVRKITYDEWTSRQNSDTIHYYYDEQKRLKKTEQFFSRHIITREYFFDTQGNLQKITGFRKLRDEDYTYANTEELFGGYDNTPNPLKGICLWEDLLYRTLSTNNFTTYSFKRGDEFQNYKWKLFYNDKGQVDYSK